MGKHDFFLLPLAKKGDLFFWAKDSCISPPPPQPTLSLARIYVRERRNLLRTPDLINGRKGAELRKREGKRLGAAAMGFFRGLGWVCFLLSILSRI